MTVPSELIGVIIGSVKAIDDEFFISEFTNKFFQRIKYVLYSSNDIYYSHY